MTVRSKVTPILKNSRMRTTSMYWVPLLPLVGVLAVWSCAVDSRSPQAAGDPAMDGMHLAPSGAGMGADPGVEGDTANGCSGEEEPCVDMLVDVNRGDVACPGCFLGGECLAAGELNPDNPCQMCDPALDGAGWSSNEGAACDDGLFCTTDDLCQAGACLGTERECEDGIECNGVSVCLEEDEACSPDENQCDDPPLCDVATDECVADCEGCVVDGICHAPGAAASQNPCWVCEPEVSTTRLTVAEGQPCGSVATECSAQDTCSAEGRCEPNDLESGAPCGAAVLNECDAADACDGDGRCVAGRAENGSSCEDGLLCTVSDQCQASTCLGGGPRSCGPDERCSEESGGCICAGCTIAGNCVAAGAQDPANACQICDPARSAEAYSANVGASCGAAGTDCSGQDTCNEQGQCAPNHLAAGTACGAPGGDQCDVGDACDGNGQCAERVARNGDPCDDGQFCTSGDTCQGGVCRSGGPRSCGANQTCDESNQQCRCTGCLINGNCIGAGARNPANPCQVCDPARNASGFINDVGANCGSAASTCSGQDTCNAQGQCQPNHQPQGTACGGPASGQCDAPDSCNGQGQCIARQAANGAACEDGLFCTQGDTCQNGGCVGGGRNCGNQACDENANRCGADNGQPCSVNSDCLSGTCRTWFRDNDGDQYGSTTTRTCGNSPPGGFVERGGDCCDVGGGNAAVAAQVHPDQQRFFPQGQVVCPNVAALDYNCSGAVEVGPHPPFTECRDLSLSDCSSQETAVVWGTDFAPTPDLCGLPAQASVCQPVFNQCDDSGEITFIGIPCH
jgi:hypothetical protein